MNLLCSTTNRIAAIAIVATFWICGNGIAQDRPNILFIAVDDLRPSTGSYGDELAVTPNMDRLAKRGLQFDRAYCQVAVCNPSRASLMTGQRPDKLGVWTLPIHFREAQPDAVTMPQWFRKFGYTAVSHGKIYHNPTPDPQSWSEPVQPLPQLPYPYPEGTRQMVKSVRDQLPANDWRKRNLRGPSTASPDLADNQLLDGNRTDAAIADLKRLSKKNEPFFLAMGYVRPHLSFIAPKKYWDMHDPSKLPVVADAKRNANTPLYALHNNSEFSHYADLAEIPNAWDSEKLPNEKARQLVHGYYACVSYVDAQIGRLMDALEESGKADNTIIVLWSDHGYKLGEYRAWGKMSNYEIDTRVPLLISGPGIKTAGQRTNQLAELLDLFPTLCDMAGIDTPDFVDGKSLKPVLNDVNQEVRSSAISQYFRRRRDDPTQYMGYAIRTDRYRFVEWREFETGKVTARELYDHSSGSRENENIADKAAPELITQLTNQLLETHPRRELVMLPKVHSQSGANREKVGFTLVNESESVAMVNLITATGRRTWKFKQIKRIQPGKELTLENARVGDTYVVESEDGKLQEVHSVPAEPKPVTLKYQEK